MNTRILYRVFISGIILVMGVFGILHLFEPKANPRVKAMTAPTVSPLSEVEFESGTTYLKLRAAQEAELTHYRENPTDPNFAQVPLERAITAYLEGAR